METTPEVNGQKGDEKEDAVLEISSEHQLLRVLSSKSRAVLNFWAPWAPPCVQMNAVFDALANATEQGAPATDPISFYRVAAETHPKLAANYHVSSVPTFIFVGRGRVVARQEGADPELLAKQVAWLGSAEESDLRRKALVELTNESPVMLFMKGTPEAPRCGFSRQIVDVLRRAGVHFGHYDILSDQETRDGLKELHSWPTYPQLYAQGRLIGGLDIVRELADTGELITELGRKVEDDPMQDSTEPSSQNGVPQVTVGSQAAKTCSPGATAGVLAANANAASAGDHQDESGDGLQARLRTLVSRSPVMLFMKGVPDEPRCGFSKKIVALLRDQGIEFDSFDILEDNAVRQGLKELYEWPTFPQLYARGNLIGGLDIVGDLVETDSLRDELSSAC